MTGAPALRILDLTLALILLILLAPIWLLRAVLALISGSRLFDPAEMVGRDRQPFTRLSFAGPLPGRELAVLFNILSGDLAFTGPRPLTADEAATVPAQAAIRFSVRPGLFSPYQLQQRTGIAHDPESDLDRAFVERLSVRQSLGLIIRSLIAGLLGGSERPIPPVLDFFGVPIANVTMDAALDWIAERVLNKSAADTLPASNHPGASRHPSLSKEGKRLDSFSGAKALLAFVNPDCLNIAYTHDRYRTVLQQAARVLPDGIGLKIGCRMRGLGLAANVNGTDLFPRLCERAARDSFSLFLLGARPGIAELVAENMQARYPSLTIAGIQHGYFSPAEEVDLIARINASQAGVLLVAFGVPRQELWLAEHHDQLLPPVRMGVGGLFDFYSGRIPRAPLWLREIGLEWVWRLIQEPGRMWRRYLLGNPLFLYRVWKQARQEIKR
ncbi:MAG: WecB/TagA/CpsF family glycosyltransferase [Candidatus Contendobacter sp.]|jgi:N-acetylglucosaminyldiphosphoundecaprenol N-acetyl-beta-D-mannosaminyltransferase|nr:WecB/TagA/CpsF family glycosyltransferase [Gammaproteobacteria bacterium]MCC8993615.1 WecB/TagA/CpsF family glycosyltransferase [Candidatus Contendobacter sp.]